MLKITENKNSKKFAIILFNLGGPDSIENVKDFLFNLFNDKYIIRLPKIFRFIIAKIISTVRAKKSSKIYSLIGGKSPILSNTNSQLNSLKKSISEKTEYDFELFTCMRHSKPNSEEVVKNLNFYNPDEIILLPLYPQFSTTTTLSSISDFINKIGKKNVKTICCYFMNDNFIKAHTNLINNTLKKHNISDVNSYRILFSAHSLPVSIIKSGDPYEWQITKTVENIVSKLEIKNLDYKITYQSKVGYAKWLQPNTENEIHTACKENKNLIIVPISFVSEHVETLVELDIEYRSIMEFYDSNIMYARVPTLSINKYFIECLSEVVLSMMESSKIYQCNRICPDIFSKCPNKLLNL